jgi:hypothetical protein
MSFLRFLVIRMHQIIYAIMINFWLTTLIVTTLIAITLIATTLIAQNSPLSFH